MVATYYLFNVLLVQKKWKAVAARNVKTPYSCLKKDKRKLERERT
jgi:hypothetical protein